MPSGFANNNGTHLHSLISAFVIPLLESIISKHTPREISLFKLVYVAEQAGLSLTLSETPKTGFLTMRSICPLVSVTLYDPGAPTSL